MLNSFESVAIENKIDIVQQVKRVVVRIPCYNKQERSNKKKKVSYTTKLLTEINCVRPFTNRQFNNFTVYSVKLSIYICMAHKLVILINRIIGLVDIYY